MKFRFARLRFGSPMATMLLAAAACLEPYPPPPGSQNLNLLVVDGFLNATTGVAQVKLSRTLALGDANQFPAEFGAFIQVVDENGIKFSLPEVSPGMYTTTNNTLSIGSRYHLEIRTKWDERFESDQVMLKQSPVLEDLFWVEEGNGITIKVDSRDPSGESRYYQWIYSEVWEYDSDSPSSFILTNGQGVPRRPDQMIHICYSAENSSKVLVSTTNDQSGDFINDFSLTHIPIGSKKLCRLYSITVEQRALEEEAYNYWLQLQRTNENLGGLFDPLPSEVIGNIHATNDISKRALGYFSGGGVEQKRIFIYFNDLPNHLRYVDRQFCPMDSVSLADLNRYEEGHPLIAPYGYPFVEGYLVTDTRCIDCRDEGGTLTKPSFWPR